MAAKIIAVCGPDRVGKATQVSMLSKRLGILGKKVCVFEVPVKSPITYPLIYFMLKSGLVKNFPNLFQVIQSLNKLAFQIFILPFFYLYYDYVIFDRWSLSAIIYGDASGADKRITNFFFRLMKKPDATIVINGIPRNLEVRDAYEADRKFQDLVSVGYTEWAQKNSDIARLVDNAGSRDDVHKRVVASLYDLGICDITI